MISIIKMDLQRMLKNKKFYIVNFSYLSLLGVSIFLNNKFDENISQTDLISVIASIQTWIPIFFGIYLTSFICHEYSSGFVKNSFMMHKNRGVHIIAKLFDALFISIISMILTLISSILFSFIFIEGFRLGNTTYLIYYLVASILMNTAIFSLIIFICTLSQNKSYGIITIFLLSLGLTNTLIELGLDLIALRSLSNYTLSKITQILPGTFDSTLMFRAVVISIIYIFMYNIGSVLILNKKDI